MATPQLQALLAEMKAATPDDPDTAAAASSAEGAMMQGGQLLRTMPQASPMSELGEQIEVVRYAQTEAAVASSPMESVESHSPVLAMLVRLGIILQNLLRAFSPR